MFTGIVEITGEVHGIEPRTDGIELLVRARFDRTLKIGESVAVNGCCLTVEKTRARGKEGLLQFGVLKETWQRTNLQFAKPGSRVNLERALRVGDSLGGHFVSGHIDDVGKIKRWEQVGKDYLLEIAALAGVMRYVVFKGSIAVDGISLTVAKVRKGSFEVWIIPHTRSVTALKERRAGDAVNLETDMLGKFVERFINERNSRPSLSGSAA